MDKFGNIFITDFKNNKIRMIFNRKEECISRLIILKEAFFELLPYEITLEIVTFLFDVYLVHSIKGNP